MALQVLGLQASRSAGTEATFDGQPMTAGIHLRWSFTPQLGFPPGAFWLLRRITKRGERHSPRQRPSRPRSDSKMPRREPLEEACQQLLAGSRARRHRPAVPALRQHLPHGRRPRERRLPG